LRVITAFCWMIFYLAGCNLLNDFTRQNAEQSPAQIGISGVWFPSNPKITLDTIRLEVGKKNMGFSHKEAESGILFEQNQLLAKVHSDSSLHLNLQLKGRHLLISSYMASIETGEMMCYMNDDSLQVLTKQISDIYCDGTKFEALDSLRRLCLGIYLEDSNVIRIRGYFAGKNRTVIIDDQNLKVYSRTSPSYQTDCDLAAAALKPRHEFSKKQVQEKQFARDDSPMKYVPTLQMLLSIVRLVRAS
jgi:hypothetical protein